MAGVRVPLASGSRLPLVTVPDDAVLLAPPPPLDPIADVGAAVVEALRYPLAGPALHAVAPRVLGRGRHRKRRGLDDHGRSAVARCGDLERWAC